MNYKVQEHLEPKALAGISDDQAGLFNWWVSSHEQGHPAGFHPVLVLDVFEHAYLVDFGAGGREEYVAAFLENVNWEVVEQRYLESKAGRFTARF